MKINNLKLKIGIIFTVFLFYIIAPHAVKASASFGSSPVTSLQNGLIGYWTLDGSVTNWKTGRTYDSSGNNITGSLIGFSTSTSPTAGKFGQGLYFDGVNSYIQTSSEFIGTSAVSVCFWLYPKTYGSEDFISNGKFIFLSSSNFRFTLDSDGATTAQSSNNAVVLNTWNFLCATRTASGVANLYKNAVLSGTANQNSGTPAAGTGNVVIGANVNTASKASGVIDDVRIYNRVLSAGEIQQLYNLGFSKFNNSPLTSLQNGLSAYWTLDGQTLNWAKGLAYDSSGNGLNATLFSMSTSTTPAAGKIGQSLNFDNNDDVLRMSTDFIGTAPASVCLWFYPKSWSSDTVFANSKFQIVSSTNLRFVFSSDGSVTTVNSNVNAISLNDWNFLCATRDASGVANIYTQGVLNGAPNRSSGTPAAGGSIGIGNNFAGGHAMDGRMDDIRVYNRVLSPLEIQELYNLGAAKFNNSPITALQNGLVGYWTFDGQHTNWRTGKTYDQSGNKNDGTLTSMSTSTSPTAGKFGQALNFDGVDDYVDAGNITALNSASAATVSFWLYYPFAQSLKEFVYKGDSALSSLNFTIQTNVSGSDFVASWAGASSHVDVTGYFTNYIGSWLLVTVVFDGSQSGNTNIIKIYRNGVLQPSTSAGSVPSTSSSVAQTLKFGGASASVRSVNAKMDDIRIYNRALSAAEVQMLYLIGK